MGQKLVVGPVNRGLRNDVTPFNIDNDSFPTLTNAYQWRGRVKRKRGTTLLNRLTRFFNSTVSSYSSSSTFSLVLGAGNILTGFSLQANGNIIPGSVTITNTTVAQTYTDLNEDGTLQGNLGGSGTINYATGAITITGGAGNSVSASFLYYPDLPVLGLEELILESNDFPGQLGFDTTYSYNISTTQNTTDGTYPIYDVSFYKNLATGTYPGYVQKTNWTPTTWNGQDYQQFFTVNYQGALWATNGINVPFSVANVGMQYKPIITTTIIAGGPPATVSLQITGHGLVVGDFVYINEVVTTTGINFQTGYVITVTDANNVIVEFPNATIATNGTGGIAQYLTSRSDTTKDSLRWYDGDPTDGNATTPSFLTGRGWVNFSPPLSQSNFSISDLPAAQYYLVGARMIVPFKDRLLFIGPVVQTSSAGSQKYLKDTIIYSQDGTPYYTSSYTNTPNAAIDTPVSASNVFTALLVPTNQTATAPAYFEDQTGFGGFITAGIDQAINSVSTQQDVLILGFEKSQFRLVYTGNDLIPFNFFTINSELGSSSVFSAITTDKGAFSVGSRGFLITSQVSAERIDLDIPDEVFQISRTSNGNERFTAQRDFDNEWIYFTFPSNNQITLNNKFPNTTLQYNYRSNSWSVFLESYTTYGTFTRRTGRIWSTIGFEFPSWSVWNEPWNSGSTNLLDPDVIAGNQQGFIVFRDEGTTESTSLYIQSFSSSTVTSPDHGLNEGDFIKIEGCIGTISAQVNNFTFQVTTVTQNTFVLSPNIGTGTYSGGGKIRRLYKPYIQTKQFPLAWDSARKTRIGPQQYLFTRTDKSQIQLLIFLSQNAASAYNEGPIVPAVGTDNNALIYSSTLFTCPESTNLGLTPANINLQTPTASQQSQIWHRMNTSLIGDTVQIGFTISDEQMMELTEAGDPVTITNISPPGYPTTITCANSFSANQLVRIDDVEGMVELNGNAYNILSATSSSIVIDVNSSPFGTYVSGGTATQVAYEHSTAEVELHGFILDVSPSQLLV